MNAPRLSGLGLLSFVGRCAAVMGGLASAACEPATEEQASPSASTANVTTELGASASAAEMDPARAAALKEAQEFGMPGVLQGPASNSPWSDPDAFDAKSMWGGDVSDHFGGGELSGRTGGSAGPRSGKPPSVRKGELIVSGKLPSEVVQRIVRQNFGRFRLCYENGLRTDPKLGGRVTLTFTIRRNGTVESSSATSDLAIPEVAACMARGIDGLTFPEPEGGVVKVSYTVLLAPGEPAADAKP